MVGGDWGQDNFPNSHHYYLELQLQGTELDEHGYLADIVELSAYLDELVSYFAEKLLNDLPEFRGINPSMENFSRILAKSVDKRIRAGNITGLQVRLSRDEGYWASYEIDRRAHESP